MLAQTTLHRTPDTMLNLVIGWLSMHRKVVFMKQNWMAHPWLFTAHPALARKSQTFYQRKLHKQRILSADKWHKTANLPKNYVALNEPTYLNITSSNKSKTITSITKINIITKLSARIQLVWIWPVWQVPSPDAVKLESCPSPWPPDSSPSPGSPSRRPGPDTFLSNDNVTTWACNFWHQTTETEFNFLDELWVTVTLSIYPVNKQARQKRPKFALKDLHV
jgi:hypothetical protein